MSLPNNFSPSEHFQDVARRVLNPNVRDWFGEITADEDGIASSRSSLRTACTHLDNDSLLLTVGRMLLFEATIRERQSARGTGTTDRAPHVLRKSKPKLKLFFLEDIEDIEPGYSPVTGEISFRLMGESSAALTPGDAITYANRVKTQFANGGGLIWRKGKLMISYSDWEKGYQLQLLCRDKAEGRSLINKVLEIQGHTPDWSFMNVSENEEPSSAFPTVPDREVIFGQTRRLPRRRPIASVRFQYAVIEMHGLSNPVCLVDRSGTFPEPVVSM